MEKIARYLGNLNNKKFNPGLQQTIISDLDSGELTSYLWTGIQTDRDTRVWGMCTKKIQYNAVGASAGFWISTSFGAVQLKTTSYPVIHL